MRVRKKQAIKSVFAMFKPDQAILNAPESHRK